MECPTDGSTLLMSERQGVEVDYCPQCRGLWLDRGELDKILDRARSEFGSASSEPLQQQQQQTSRGHRAESQYGDRRGGYQQKRKKSPFEFLGDIFEG